MSWQVIYSLGILFSSSLEQYNYMLFPHIQSILMPYFYQGPENIGFIVLLLAALFRPLGSWGIGYLGDRYSRRFALLFSMILMGFSCFLILLLPQYSLIGNHAILGLIFARILQVISISGEHVGIAIFLTESWSSNNCFTRYGFASGLVFLFPMFGAFLVTLVVSLLDNTNWQYGYIFSLILTVFCFFLRLLPHSEFSSSVIEEDQSSHFFWNNFFACFLISASMSALYYFNTIAMPFYFAKYGGIEVRNFNILFLFLYMFSTFFFGWLSDFVQNLYFFILIPCLLLFFTIFGVLYFVSPFLHCINIFLLAVYAGPSHAFFFKLFPKKNRYRGIAIAYSLGSSFIGSSCPWIASSLMFSLSLTMLYVSFLLFLALLGGFLARSTLHNTL